MDNAMPEFDHICRQMMSLERLKKPKMLVVDDELDNLDLLYRTFRRDFQVFKAESGIKALEVLATQGEVAVIISDQRMPEMKGTEFLRKTLPDFPDTMRIILTGFTDIQDLVEAINSGQVYKYITKPWDAAELKAVVQQATETYELLKQRTEELRRANAQMALLAVLVQIAHAPPMSESLTPIARAFGESLAADGCILQLVQGNALVADQGSYSDDEPVENWLAQDPLTTEAIATHQMQASVNIPGEPQLAGMKHYQESGVQAHLIIPITYRGEVLAVLSLQWKKPCTLREDELRLIHISAQLVAIAITCTRCSSPM
jgi:CheY-like chemotaxis protein